MSKSKFQPGQNRYLIQPIAETAKSSLIIIPDSAKEKPVQGKIIGAGPGKNDSNGKRQPLEFSVGDTVIFAKYGGTEIKLDGVEFLIIAEDDIHGKIIQ